MEIELLFALGMFLAAIAALLAGYPVALTLGGTALILAAYNDHDGCVDLLVKAGASLDVQNQVGGHGWWAPQAPATQPPRSRPSLVYPVPPLLLHGNRSDLLCPPHAHS